MKPYNGTHKNNPIITESKRSAARDLLAAEGNQLLFCIERNVNSNQVVYFVRPHDLNNFIDVEWINWGVDSTGKSREKLTHIEKLFAYGIKVSNQENSIYQLDLVSLKNHPITVKTTNRGSWIALLEIEGKMARLQKIYVFTVSNLLGIPQVEYVDLSFKFIDDDKIQHLRIAP